MSDLPAPLTPANCDLRDFSFMPLEINRLRRSKAWLKAKRNPALAFYQINLWTAAWHDLPAGSLEDDDDVLADLAMCSPEKWDRVRTEVLRGWVKCSDGRLYNPTVCEKAKEAWDSKLDQRWRTECARIKKHNDRHHTDVVKPTFEEWIAAGFPQGQRLPVPRDTAGTGAGQVGETGSKGQGEGQRQGEGYIDSVPTGTGGPAADIPAAAAALQANDRALTDEEEKLLWNAALALLIPSYSTGNEKTKDAKARSFIGGLGKRLKDAQVERRALFDVIQAACVERPANPEEWMAAAIANRTGRRHAPNKQEAQEQRNHAVADDWAAKKQRELEATNAAV